jgi:hypothetical protein
LGANRPKRLHVDHTINQLTDVIKSAHPTRIKSVSRACKRKRGEQSYRILTDEPSDLPAPLPGTRASPFKPGGFHGGEGVFLRPRNSQLPIGVLCQYAQGASVTPCRSTVLRYRAFEPVLQAARTFSTSAFPPAFGHVSSPPTAWRRSFGQLS